MGTNYATAAFYITDSYGLTSSTNSITINVLPSVYLFPIPSGPGSYTNLVNSQSTIMLSATNYTGAPAIHPIFELEALPSHGQLLMGNRAFTQVPTTLSENSVLTYAPNAGYYSSLGGLDSIAYRTSSQDNQMTCDVIITLHVLAPPVISQKLGGAQPTVTVDANGMVVIPASFTNFTVAALDAGTNAILQVTVAGNPAGSAPYGFFSLNSTNGLTGVQSNAPCSLQLQGTAAALNPALAGGMKYYCTPSSTAGVITATLSDLGTTGIGTNSSSVSLTVLYLCPNCTISN